MGDPLFDRVVAAVQNHYAVENEIGRGGMSVVYRARDVRLNRVVAIKVLPPELAHDPGVRARFTREAQTSAQLAHAHIVPIYDVGEREGIAYFVMSYVSGGNLAALLAREPHVPVEEVRRLLVEIADALAYAHMRGVIHRDIKPDNILLDRESGRAMVTDFGIARAVESGTRLTVTGIAVGTPTYMSPEQAEGEKEIDGRSDIYSLGVLGYQLLTGRVPFTAGNTMALLLKHISERARPIADLRPDAPKLLRDAIDRAMVKAPEDRWPTAAALRDALTSGEAQVSWRAENREPVRYTSPRPESRRDRAARDTARAEPRGVAARRDASVPVESVPQRPIVIEQDHLVSLTPDQRKDLRLWHGRVHLYERIKAARGYAVVTLGALIGGFVGLAGVEDIPPLILGPVVAGYMTVKLWRRGKSLRNSGAKLRRVFLMPRAKWVLPREPRPPKPPKELTRNQLQKIAPREVLESPLGAAVRRAAADKAAILELVAKLSKADRALLPDIAPTVDALVQRVVHVAESLHRLDQSMDPRIEEDLDLRIAAVEGLGDSPENQRQLALLQRQRGSIADLAQRRATLARQLDNAGLALGNLRLDLIKLRSSGLQSALSDVSTATQEARALSSEIGAVLDAVAEVRRL